MIIERVEFWSNFYKENLIFLKENLTFLESIEVKANFEDPEDIDLFQSVINNTLSPVAREEGYIKVTLNEVIRFMISLKFKLSFINSVCKELTLLHNIDEGLAYSVFRDTEDEFTTRYYGHRYRNIN